MTAAELHIPALRSGGLVLGYGCPSRCRHCLYGAGPHRRDGAPRSAADLDPILDELAARGRRAAYHIGGGEPFLDVDLLEHAVRGMAQRGLALDYVETNAAWATSTEKVDETLSRLAAAGLSSLLVSLSPFHAELVPFERTGRAIAGARRHLASGAFVWLPHFLPDLEGTPEDQRLDLDATLERRGGGYARSLADRYGLVPAGRAGRYLARWGRSKPWDEVARAAPCRTRLTDTSHFHVDADGLYVPGLCAGIVLRLDEVPGSVDLSPYPVLAALLGPGGLEGLVAQAAETGFEPLPAGYSSPCDLCTHVRTFLFGQSPSPELGPAGFYDSRSVPGFERPPGDGGQPGTEAPGLERFR